MTKVLAVFNHRPEKVSNILPYSGLEYEVSGNPLKSVVRRKRILPKVRVSKRFYPLLRFVLLPINTIRLLFFPKSKFKAKELIMRYDPDIVFTHGGGAANALMVETKKAGKKFVMRLGGHPYEEFRDNLNVPGWRRVLLAPVHGTHYWFLIRNLKAADHIIVVADDMKYRLVERYGYPENKISVVPVPIDVSKFNGKKIQHKGKMILTIANVNFLPKVRAVLDYYKAIMNVVNNVPNVKWKLVIPGRYGDYLKSKLGDIDNRKVEVMGYVKNVSKLYRRADIVAYFSYLDSVPNIVLEAWASNIPVVANTCEWSNELIRDGNTGLLVESVSSAVDSIKRLLSDEKLCRQLTTNAYDYLIKHHTEKIAGERLGEVLSTI